MLTPRRGERGPHASPGSSSGLPSLDYADISSAIEKRLFIGKVPPGTTDEELQSVFAAYGPLKECRVVPDRSGGSNNGIGFVSFETWAAAHRAMLETDSQRQLRGHEGTPSAIVASFAERTRGVGRGGGAAYAKGLDIARIFVGSLPEDASEAEIIERFSAVGAVEGASMLPAKSRLRCGFVNFQIWGEALDAVEQLHGQPLRLAGGEPMSVVLAQPKDSGGHERGSDRGRDRGHHERERELERSRDRDRGHDRDGGGRDRGHDARDRLSLREPSSKRRRTDGGASTSDQLTPLLNAYVAAVHAEGPSSICDLLHEQLMKVREQLGLSSRRLPRAASPPRKAPQREHEPRGGGGGSGRSYSASAPLSLPSSGGGGSATSGDRDSARLFVGGLPFDCTDEDLASLVSQLRFALPEESCQLMECRVLSGRGCGYVRYASWEAAEEAFQALQGRAVDGWPQPLRLQWATPKPEKLGGGGGGASAKAAPVLVDNSGMVAQDPLAMASREEVEGQGLEPTRLFIGQIARDSDAGNVLRPVFEQYGEIQEFRWVQDKGVLYVAYTTFEEAQAAMQALSNASFAGISKGLNVRFSQRRP